MKSAGVAYLLWMPCFCLFCGLHRFYAGKPLTGFLWLFTFGLLGIGQFIDLFLIPSMVADENIRNGYATRFATQNVTVVDIKRGRRRYDDEDDDEDDDRPRRRRR